MHTLGSANVVYAHFDVK